jgi:uncharacterized protein (TIGR03435 family)
MKNIRVTSTFVLVTLLMVTTASAQTPNASSTAVTSATTFDVVSVKPSPAPDPANPLSGVPMAAPQPGGRFMAANMPLWGLISTAWGFSDFRIVGGNKELMNAKYHISAVAPAGVTLGEMELQQLLKNLLVQRFKLKSHIESREMPQYDLVLARGEGKLGPELKPSKSDCANNTEAAAKQAEAVAKGDVAALIPQPGAFPPCTISPNIAGGPLNIALHGDGQEIKVLVALLSQFTGREVRDKTGLTGRYDFDLKVDIQTLMALVQKMGMNVPAAGLANLPQADGAAVMTALNEQLGLKLESTRGPVDVLVVDSVEAPTPD